MNHLDDWVSQEFQNLAQVINDYDHHLFLEMIPVAEQQHLTDKSKCFRIVDGRTNTVVMHADSLSTPQDILARLWNSDNTRGNVLSRVDARNAAVEALNMRKHIDELEAQKDFALFVVKNEKSKWKAPDGTYRDEHFNNLGTGKTVID